MAAGTEQHQVGGFGMCMKGRGILVVVLLVAVQLMLAQECAYGAGKATIAVSEFENPAKADPK